MNDEHMCVFPHSQPQSGDLLREMDSLVRPKPGEQSGGVRARILEVSDDTYKARMTAFIDEQRSKVAAVAAPARGGAPEESPELPTMTEDNATADEKGGEPDGAAGEQQDHPVNEQDGTHEEQGETQEEEEPTRTAETDGDAEQAPKPSATTNDLAENVEMGNGGAVDDVAAATPPSLEQQPPTQPKDEEDVADDPTESSLNDEPAPPQPNNAAAPTTATEGDDGKEVEKAAPPTTNDRQSQEQEQQHEGVSLPAFDDSDLDSGYVWVDDEVRALVMCHTVLLPVADSPANSSNSVPVDLCHAVPLHRVAHVTHTCPPATTHVLSVMELGGSTTVKLTFDDHIAMMVCAHALRRALEAFKEEHMRSRLETDLSSFSESEEGGEGGARETDSLAMDKPFDPLKDLRSTMLGTNPSEHLKRMHK